MAGKGSKPGERRGGRKKGIPNKVTRDLREAIITAWGRLGGIAFLVRLGKAHPNVFSGLLAKLLPTQLTGANGGPIAMDVSKLSDDELKALSRLRHKLGLAGADRPGNGTAATRH